MKLIKLNSEFYLIEKGNIGVGEIGMHYMNPIDVAGNYTFKCCGNEGLGRHKYCDKDTNLLTEHCYKIIASTNMNFGTEIPILDKDKIENSLNVMSNADIVELADKYEKENYSTGGINIAVSFRDGYRQCQKDNADKKFTLSDMERAWKRGFMSDDSKLRSEFIKELKAKKTEWDAEIEMEVPVQIREVGKPLIMIPKIINGCVNILSIK